MLRMHPFFFVLVTDHPPLARHICADTLMSVPLAPEELVFEQFEASSRMYFVQSGSLNYIVWHNKDSNAALSVMKCRHKIKKGDSLSEAVLWICQWNHRGDLIA